MKKNDYYSYEFADGGKCFIPEEEIPEDVLSFLRESDRRERANNNKETRRHIHWEKMYANADDVEFPLDRKCDTACDIWREEKLASMRSSPVPHIGHRRCEDIFCCENC
jgi:hypothetical protein